MLAVTASPDTRAAKILLKYGKRGDADAMALLELAYAEHAWRAAVHADLPWLYAERELVESLLGVGVSVSGLDTDTTTAPLVDWKEADVSESGSQRGGIYAKIIGTLTDRITALETLAGANRAPAIGQLTTTAPVSVPDTTPLPATPDPNERAYRGDPLRRTGWGP